MVKVQHSRRRGQGMHGESQDSRSPDSACSLEYDRRESSPDYTLHGEVFL